MDDFQITVTAIAATFVGAFIYLLQLQFWDTVAVGLVLGLAWAGLLLALRF